MDNSFDLDAYFERVNWRGSTAPTYETMAGLLEAQIAHIPFENFDVLLGLGVRLDLPGLTGKLIAARRGGYCFEHATLLAAALARIGFEPRLHLGRVVAFLPASQSPRGHGFLSVAVNGARYVLDPGFGAHGSRVPLPLAEAGAPDIPRGHRLALDGALWTMSVIRDGVEKPGWVSTLEEEHPVDFEMSNHFMATHPRASMRNQILASAVFPGGRVNIFNRDVTIIRGARVETYQLPDRSALRGLIAEHFGYDLPGVETMRVPNAPGWA